MSPKVVHDDDIAFAQRRRQDLLDIGKERRPIHRPVDDIGRGQPFDAQRGHECQRFPVTVRHARNETLATR